MAGPESVMPAPQEILRGNLAQTNAFDVLQFLHTSSKSGEFYLFNAAARLEARVYFSAGHILHAECGPAEGMEALVTLIGWNSGYFTFSSDVASPCVSIDIPVEHAIMEAARVFDERVRLREEKQESRSSTEILKEFLRVPDIVAAAVIARDGEVIEHVVGEVEIDIDRLARSLGKAVGGIDALGQELEIGEFDDLHVGYRGAVILCRPLGSALVALIAPDSAKIGILRHKLKKLAEELERLL
jgi:predicted regulator of Ras-like GTPase activity (Roadblock/LC7/MglB family)